MGSAVERCHALLAAWLRPGQRAIDATAGRGRDTLLLARLLGPAGRVLAIDLQSKAIEASMRLIAADPQALAPVRFELGDHAQLVELAGPDWRGATAALVMNLGYLPGGDRRLITRSASTLAALHGALELLAPGGLLALVVYPGHPGGETEAQQVEAWLDAREGRELERLPESEPAGSPYPPGAPRLLAARRRAPAAADPRGAARL